MKTYLFLNRFTFLAKVVTVIGHLQSKLPYRKVFLSQLKLGGL